MVKNLSAKKEMRVWSLGWEEIPGEVNGNPLQYSCLGNPMDRRAWWATVGGDAKSQTWISNLTTSRKKKKNKQRHQTKEKKGRRASLVVWWLRICPAMQGTLLQSLGQEDPTCHKAIELVPNNYWGCAQEPVSQSYWVHTLQLLKPAHL